MKVKVTAGFMAHATSKDDLETIFANGELVFTEVNDGYGYYYISSGTLLTVEIGILEQLTDHDYEFQLTDEQLILA
jgi:hypothetical protein